MGVRSWGSGMIKCAVTYHSSDETKVR